MASSGVYFKFAELGTGVVTQAHPRRTRRLQLDELVAGALLRYPVYLSAATGQRCTAEQGLDELLQWRERQPAKDPWWRRWVRPLIARP